MYDVNVDSCCHGGVRKDSMKFWCTVQSWCNQRLAKRGKVRVDGAVFHRSVASFSEEQVGTVSQFGIPRSPVVFCNRAVKCGHPRGMSLHLPEVVTQVLRDILVTQVLRGNLEVELAELALVRCRPAGKVVGKSKVAW